MISPLRRLQAEIGRTYVSDWLLVDQDMIDRFADVTGDHQFIHVDPERPATTRFGGDRARLPAALATPAASGEYAPGAGGGREHVVNCGFERVRFVAPVRSGPRVRTGSTLVSVEEKRQGQLQQLTDVTLEIKGSEKPALTAAWISQVLF